MAIKQYIGARYVPKFVGTFDSTKEYEPLSIVEDGNGNSYTSKIRVPVGSSLTDQTYWVKTSTMSGEMQQIETRLQNAESNITTAETNINLLDGRLTVAEENINNLVSDVSSAETNINSLDGRLTVAEENINNIVSDVSSLDDRVTTLENDVSVSGKNIVIVGDSYGMRNTPNYITYFRDKYTNVHSTADSGHGFLPINGEFINDLNNLVSGWTEEAKNNVTDIIFAGGWNDARMLALGSTEAQLLAAIKNCVEEAATICKNARIHVAFIAWQTSYNTQPQVTFEQLKKAREQYQSPEVKANIMFGVDYVMHDVRNFDITFFHPDGKGGLELFRALDACLYGGSYTYRASYVVDEGQLSVPPTSSILLINSIEGDHFETHSTIFTSGASSNRLFKFDSKTIPFCAQGNAAVFGWGIFSGTYSVQGSTAPVQYNGIITVWVSQDFDVKFAIPGQGEIIAHTANYCQIFLSGSTDNTTAPTS